MEQLLLTARRVKAVMQQDMEAPTGKRRVRNKWLPTALSRLTKEELTIWCRRFNVMEEGLRKEGMLEKLYELGRDELPRNAEKLPNMPPPPNCPRCYLMQVPRRNSEDKSLFWGCVNDPKCTGTSRWSSTGDAKTGKEKAVITKKTLEYQQKLDRTDVLSDVSRSSAIATGSRTTRSHMTDEEKEMMEMIKAKMSILEAVIERRRRALLEAGISEEEMVVISDPEADP